MRRNSTVFHRFLALLGLACGLLLIPATTGNLAAQETGNPATPPASPGSAPAAPGAGGAFPGDNSAVPGSAAATNPAAINSPPAPTSVPNSPALFYSPQGSPLIPQQGPNALSPTQSAQLTTPSLFTTGTNDLSQIATDSSLSRAFSQGSASGFYSNSEPGATYSNGPLGQVRLGPFVAQTALSTSVVADDNVQPGGQPTAGSVTSPRGTSGTGRQGDTYFTVTPAVLVEYGAEEGQKGFVSVTYAPSIQRFVRLSGLNNEDQNVVVNAEYPFQRLTLGVSEIYSQSSGVNQDSNTRTTQTTQVSTAGANYLIDDKLSFAASVEQATTSFSKGEGEGDRSSSVNSSLNYQVSEKLTFGPSVNIGEDDPQGGQGEPGQFGNSSSKYVQGLFGANYQATAKISASAQAGVELRQFDRGEGNTTDPIFALGIAYVPFDSTSISLNAFQSERASSLDSDQVVTSTGVGISATQRLVQRFYLTLSLSYEHDDYQQVGGPNISASPSYSEDGFVYRPSVAYNPTLWTSVAIYYQYITNETDGLGNSYHDNQVGLSISAQF